MGKRSRNRPVITQKRRPPRHGLQVWIGLTCLYPAKQCQTLPRQTEVHAPRMPERNS